jgi:hypothetical protein
MTFKSKRGPSTISRVLLKLVRSYGFPQPKQDQVAAASNYPPAAETL